MLREIALDALHFLDRTSLEGLQMHSRYLRDLVNSQAHTLPLRSIHSVEIHLGNAHIRLTENEGRRIKVVATTEKRLKMLFHRFNNAFIHRLELSFRPQDLVLPYYLQTKADELQCQVRVLCISDEAARIDYVLIDFLGTRLKPQVYETWSSSRGCHEDYVMLFMHKALRGTVKNLVYDLGDSPVPERITTELFGADVLETCAMSTEEELLPWIGNFIRAFETDERGTNMVRSVTLVHERSDDENLPQSDTVETLGQPRHTDVATPHSAFVKDWRSSVTEAYGVTLTESSVAELFVFENAKASKKLDVFVWTIEQLRDDASTALHYAFLLQVVDMK